MPGLPLSLVRSPPDNRPNSQGNNTSQAGYMFAGAPRAPAVKLQPPLRAAEDCLLLELSGTKKPMVAIFCELPNSSWCLPLRELAVDSSAFVRASNPILSIPGQIPSCVPALHTHPSPSVPWIAFRSCFQAQHCLTFHSGLREETHRGRP